MPFTLPNTFTAGAPALASQVNENFNAIKNELNELGSTATLIDDIISTSKIQDGAVTADKVNFASPVSVADPTSSGHAANKGYVDGAFRDVLKSWKASSDTRVTTKASLKAHPTTLEISGINVGDKIMVMATGNIEIDDFQHAAVYLYKDSTEMNLRLVMDNKGTNDADWEEHAQCFAFNEIFTATATEHTLSIKFKSQNSNYYATCGRVSITALRIEKAD